MNAVIVLRSPKESPAVNFPRSAHLITLFSLFSFVPFKDVCLQSQISAEFERIGEV